MNRWTWSNYKASVQCSWGPQEMMYCEGQTTLFQHDYSLIQQTQGLGTLQLRESSLFWKMFESERQFWPHVECNTSKAFFAFHQNEHMRGTCWCSSSNNTEEQFAECTFMMCCGGTARNSRNTLAMRRETAFVLQGVINTRPIFLCCHHINHEDQFRTTM